jgi:hypothetical protein
LHFFHFKSFFRRKIKNSKFLFPILFLYTFSPKF